MLETSSLYTSSNSYQQKKPKIVSGGNKNNNKYKNQNNKQTQHHQPQQNEAVVLVQAPSYSSPFLSLRPIKQQQEVSNVVSPTPIIVSPIVLSANSTPSSSPLTSPIKYYEDNVEDNSLDTACAAVSFINPSSLSPLRSSISSGPLSSFTSNSNSSGINESFYSSNFYSNSFSNLNSNFDDLSALFTSSLCMLSQSPPSSPSASPPPSQHQQYLNKQFLKNSSNTVNNSMIVMFDKHNNSNNNNSITLPPPELPHQQCAIQENIRNVISYLGCCYRFNQITYEKLVNNLNLAFNDFDVSAIYFAKRALEKDSIMPDVYFQLVEVNIDNLLSELKIFKSISKYYSFHRKYSCLDAKSYFDDYIEGTIIKQILMEMKNTSDQGTLLVNNERFNETYTNGDICFTDSELLNSKGFIPSEAMPSNHITEHVLTKKDSKAAIKYFNYLIHGSVKLIIGRIEYTCIGSVDILPNRKLCGSLKNKFLNAYAIHQQFQQSNANTTNGNNTDNSNIPGAKEILSKIYALKTMIMTAFYYHLYHFRSSNFTLHK